MVLHTTLQHISADRATTLEAAGDDLQSDMRTTRTVSVRTDEACAATARVKRIVRGGALAGPLVVRFSVRRESHP